LSRQQSALLAGAIVNPRVLTPGRPTRRLLRRQQIILARMGSEGRPPARVETDLEADAEEEPPVPPRFPLTVDEEEAQDGDAPETPEEPVVPPPEESPPA
jgi:membrane peptidoglycan carboxypeptidase